MHTASHVPQLAYLDPVSWLITLQILGGGGGWLAFRFRKALTFVGVRPRALLGEQGVVRRNFEQALIALTETPTCFRLVILVEGARDLPYLEDVVAKLAADHDVDLWLLSAERISEQRLAALGVKLGYIDNLKGSKWQLLLPKLAANLVLTTLTDLGTVRFPKSKHAKYAYIFHSLVSTHVAYEPGSFDGYDIVYCPSDRHRDELKIRDDQRGHIRPLVVGGYPFADRLISGETQPAAPAHGTILIAPSWGNDEAYADVWSRLAHDAVSAGWRVVVRPHPETLKRASKTIRIFAKRFSNNASVVLDDSASSGATAETADILITDWSGIAFEFALRPHRELIFVDLPMKVRNPAWRTIAPRSIEMDERRRIGQLIPQNAIDEIMSGIGSRADPSGPREVAVLSWLAHPGNSASFIAMEIKSALAAAR